MKPDLPTFIGPYQIVRSLGIGGMGEVFLAFDPRLKRQVAIKRIRMDVRESPERRARFQREAELAAGLNHPAIVQIHDLLTENQTGHIVMEYVGGLSLNRRIETWGPLSSAEAFPMILSIVEGLAYAHHHQVLHRDLKSENVLLTSDGRPKITDFGIARRLDDPPAASPEKGLTEDGRLLGTFRSMSPEQICGDRLDARSDLFSLGILLYEMLTGCSAFLASTRRETLQRILHQAPTPISERVPDIVPELASLVDHLLEKDPLLRPRNADEVVERLRTLSGEPATGPLSGSGTTLDSTALDDPPRQARSIRSPTLTRISSTGSEYRPIRSRRFMWTAALLLAVGALSVFFWIRVAHRPTLYVAVMEPRTTSASEETPFISAAISNGLLRTLISLDQVTPITPAELEGLSGSPKDLARAVGADEILYSSFNCQRKNCLLELRRVLGQDGAVVWSGQMQFPLEETLTASTSSSVLLYSGFRAGGETPEDEGWQILPDAYKAHLRIKQEFDAGASGKAIDSLLERAEAIRRSSDRFVPAYLVEAKIAMRKYRRTNDPELLHRALDLVRRARELDPEDPFILLDQAHVEINADQIEDAEATLLELSRRLPGHVGTTLMRARIYREAGRGQEALELFRKAEEQRRSAALLLNYARLLLQQGDFKLALHKAREQLDLQPGSSRGRRLLATIELITGEPKHAVELLEELVEESGDTLDLSNLGIAYMLIGRYGSAVDILEEARRHAPKNFLVIFNLADARLLQGQDIEAKTLYRQVLSLQAELGSSNIDLLTVRAQALVQLGEYFEAITTIQEAIRKVPESQDVAFAAAVVYTTAGDLNSALTHVGKAVELGYGPEWFQLPWFDRLRPDPRFQEILAASR